MVDTLGIVDVADQTISSHGATAGDVIIGRPFGGKPLLEWVVRRVTDSQRVDRVAVVCGDGLVREVVQRCTPPDVVLHSPAGLDPLARLADAASEFDAQSVVRVRAASPFIDPAAIDRLVTSANSAGNVDYASYCSNDGQPILLQGTGFLADWFSRGALVRAAREATDARDRRDVSRYLISHPELFQLRLIPLPPQLDREDVRLGIAVEEDWETAQAILDALGADSLDWQGIAELLDQHPRMRERMAALNRGAIHS